MRWFTSKYLVPAAFLGVLYLAGCGGSGADTEPAEAAATPGQEEHTEPASVGAAGQEAGPEAGPEAGADQNSEGQHEAGEPAEGDQAGEAAGLMAEVHLGPERSESLEIRVATVQGGSASSVVLRPATLQMDPDRRALVGPRIEAKVVRVLADLGDRVQADDTLAILSSVELGRAKATFLTARARLKTAEAEYRREQSLFEKQITSEAQLLESEAVYAQARGELNAARETLRLYGLTLDDIAAIDTGGAEPLSYFALRSPAAGRVQQRDLSPGQTVGPSETPIHVADVRRLWAMVEAYDQDVPILETGRSVDLTVRNVPGRTFRGEIDWVSYELDPETRTLKVRAVVENEDGLLRADRKSVV